MLVRPCVVLDAAMSVKATIIRLARQGYWLESTHPVARQVLEETATRLKLPVEEIEDKLARRFFEVGAAIRRQWNANILWYARPLMEVLSPCYSAEDDSITLLDALYLHEYESLPVLEAPPAGEDHYREGVIVEGNTAIAVSLENWGSGAMTLEEESGSDADGAGYDGSATITSTGSRSSTDRPSTEKLKEIHTWPRIDAPSYVPASKPFEVTVGLALTQQPGVTGGEVVLHPPQGAQQVNVDVTLVADGLEAVDGWEKTMQVRVDNPSSAAVTFHLVGHEPIGPEPIKLVILEVRYSYGGAVCGVASRPLVIGRAGTAAPDLSVDHGELWTSQPASDSPVTVQADPDVTDLTIEIFKPDGNPAKGSYVCHLYSPHPLNSAMGPFPIDLDDDAQSFAKMIVNQVRTYANSPIVDNLLESHGRLIAEKLGQGVMNALREVADLVAPATPAVLFVSADPYVPWELAYLDPPLDATRPHYLGAQVLLGRWLRKGPFAGAPTPLAATSAATSGNPPVQPPASINVKHMAIMAGMYKAASGLRRLPEAENEARTLQQTYDAVPLAASLQAVKLLLDAHLEHNFESIGGVEAIHFAGHGEYDPTNADSAVLFLSDGMPLFASLFRSAKYGGEQSPLFFLNGCMTGIGDELLGDMGGFPGNCLRGGFGGVLGALWEIYDAVAHGLALEFWRRALPTEDSEPEPVGEILRDLRAKYVPDPVKAPISTYLAYVYYCHPRLQLQLVT